MLRCCAGRERGDCSPIPLRQVGIRDRYELIDRLRYDHPYRSRSGVIVEAIEQYLRSRRELPDIPD